MNSLLPMRHHSRRIGIAFLFQVFTQQVVTVEREAVLLAESFRFLQRLDSAVALAALVIQDREQVQAFAEVVVAVQPKDRLAPRAGSRNFMQPLDELYFPSSVPNRAGQVATGFADQRPTFLWE